MQLPYNLKLLPGVQQWANGKKFQLAQYPSGKTVEVPYEETGAPPARTIPLPVEKPKVKRKIMTVRNSQGELVPFKPFQPQRLCVIHARSVKLGQVEKVILPNEKGARLLDQMRPLMVSPDCGTTWKPLESTKYDHHFAYHIDEEKTDGQA